MRGARWVAGRVVPSTLPARLGILAVAAALTACGARTGLDDPGRVAGGGGGGGAPTVTHPRIGLLGNPGANDTSSLLEFLSTRGTVTRTQTDGAALTASTLDAFDVVIVDNLVRDYTPDEARLFERWIHAGGGAMCLTGYANALVDTEHPNSLLAEVGMSYQQPLLSDDHNGEVTSFVPHPVTKSLAGVTFFGGYVVTHTSPALDVAFDEGVPVAAVSDHGAGRVYLWGDEWVEYSTEWSDPDTTRFWSDALDWLTHAD